MLRLNVVDYGADSTGNVLSTSAMQRAIDECPEGGCVYVPEGRYVSGALYLKSDMTFEVAKNARITGSDNTEDFPIRVYRWEGEERECYSSLINSGIDSGEMKNLTICGGGVIDANGETLFRKEMDEKKGARGRCICIKNADGLTIKDVIIKQSPAWCLHLINCKNIVIDGIEVHTKYNENGIRYKGIFNGDGIDLDSCTDVVIKNSMIASQDDCIAIKSGKNEEGRRAARPTENVKIENCTFKSGFGVAIGSEMSGDVRNVEVRNCDFTDTFSIGSVKTCRGRGGIIENILFENVKLVNRDTEFKDCKWFRGGIYIDSYYSNAEISTDMQPVSEETPIIRNVTFRNAEVDTIGGNAIYVSGLPEMHCENITLENIRAKGKYGMKAYFTDGLKVNNVEVKAENGEAFEYRDVEFRN